MNEKSSQRILAVLIGIGLLFVVLMPLLVGKRGRDDDAPLPKSHPKPLRDYVPGRSHRLEKLPAELELIRSLAKPKHAPVMGEWLQAHPEQGQSVADFEQERPAGGWHEGRVLYLVAVGVLTPAQEQLVERTRALLADWYQLEVKVLPPLSEEIVPPESRRERQNAYGTQWQTEPILDALLMKRPDDAAGLMAITATDLYPGPEWNFVFGEARYGARVGVMSIARHGDLMTEPTLVLNRTLTTAAHELGHMMGLQHCIAYECAMNGANSQEESDLAPNEPCPSCLAKLKLRLGLNPLARAVAVERSYADAGLPLGDLRAQLDVWRDAGVVR